MSDKLEIFNPDPNTPVSESVRIVADALRRGGNEEIDVYATGKRMKKSEYLQTMLWDLLLEGHFHFASGRLLEIESYSDWLQTFKFLANHLDGAASRESGIGINIFKVYAGIDTDRV